MSQNFSWQTDEDLGWDDPAPQPPPQPRRRLPWSWLLALAAAALLITAVIYARIQAQVKETTNRAEQDVLAAHQLSQNAAATGDLDLFRSNLSRRDASWAETQRELVTQGLFLDRTAFGLRWWGGTEIALTDAAATPTLPITITLAPDLLSAEILYEQEYLLSGSATTSETIRLQHTAVYRRGDGRWLRADPLDEFWGETREINKQFVTIRYNQRDELLVTRLAQDLNEQLLTMCQAFPSVTCNDNLPITVLFTRNPQHFFTLLDLEKILTTEEILRLPSPTLVGLPVDEAGYQAIMRGYATPLISLAVARFLGYECCHHSLFFRAFLDKELSILNLKPWPLTPEQYTQLLPSAPFDSISLIWLASRFNSNEPEEEVYLYTLVDYLAHEYPETDLALWQRWMRNGLTYWEWLETVVGVIKSQEIFNTKWLQFIQQQGSAAAAPPTLPPGELTLVCPTPEGMLNVYNYQPHTDEWGITLLDTSESPTTLGPRDTLNVFQAIPGGYITEQILSDERILVMLRNGLSAIIARAPLNEVSYTTSYPYLQLLGGRMPHNYFHFLSYSNTGNSEPQNWLVNLDECMDDNCEPQEISGMPIWSPDGRFTLLYDDYFSEGAESNINIRLGDENGQFISDVGLGQMPFWIDNSHFGYFHYELSEGGFDGTTDLYLGQIAYGPSPQPLLTHEQMLELLPQNVETDTYYMIWAAAQPGNSHHLALAVLPYNGYTARYFVLDLVWGENWQSLTSVEVIWDKPDMALPTFSVDGLFELFINLGGGSELPGAKFTLVNQITGATQVITSAGGENYYLNILPIWTDDGQWLINVTDMELLLANPYTRQEWRTPHALGICSQVFYMPLTE